MKFPPSTFLVKPQALLREQASNDNLVRQEEQQAGDASNNAGDNREDEVEEENDGVYTNHWT